MIFTCHDACKLMSRELDGELSYLERCDVKIHRVLCGNCRRYYHQLVALDDATKTALATPPDATDMILAEPTRDKMTERLSHEIRIG
jgi:predicted anti-sigma-YlaC factor YlaD